MGTFSLELGIFHFEPKIRVKVVGLMILFFWKNFFNNEANTLFISFLVVTILKLGLTTIISSWQAPESILAAFFF